MNDKLLAGFDIPTSPLRTAITDAYHADETTCVEHLLHEATLSPAQKKQIQATATKLVEIVRQKRVGQSGLDAFLLQYDLSSEEGIALMCMAEALLRIPDAGTADQLIKDKITSANWQDHVGSSESMFVNAATWGLMLTGKVYDWHDVQAKTLTNNIKRLASRSGEPVIRKAVTYAMKVLGQQFVMGRTIKEALKRAKVLEAQGYRYSYDMLGEAARTEQDALLYFQAYREAIEAIGRGSKKTDFIHGPGISVKLSALHPRYEFSKQQSVIKDISDRLLELAVLAKQWNLSLTVDAEEADRLDLSLDIIEKVFSDSALSGWEGFGLAVQSYQKRAWAVLDWLEDLSLRHKRRIMVRLIKGAYWDTEIKHAQSLGLQGYPVFTRKNSTDVSFIACAKKIISAEKAFYPMFATHNANTVATILTLMGKRKDYEFQCLHGMGQTLYDEIVGEDNYDVPCRIYAPVGSHEDLLAYLVRRLLENGANTSFVNRIVDEELPIKEIIRDPMEKIRKYQHKPHPLIPLPSALYGEVRQNSRGCDLSHWHELQALEKGIAQAQTQPWQASALIEGQANADGITQPVFSPANHSQQIGSITESTQADIETALTTAENNFPQWNYLGAEKRAVCLEATAKLLEQHRDQLIAMAIHEAGKTVQDAVAEVREAVDFCYYYAAQARQHLAEPELLPGPTGEYNALSYQGRGTILCISPWNFPLAIFTGQIAAALVTGNCVIAKPAEQTPLIAYFAVELFHTAGVPKSVLQLLPGSGEVVGAQLVQDQRIHGVMFTGSTQTAQQIQRSLSERGGAIAPLVAETGGLNAMIVDSSALPEQVVVDVCDSAFGSAGQRCSALRVLFVQEDIASGLLAMLKGAMAELYVGHPGQLSTDIGPVIDADALAMLQDHYQRMTEEAELIHQVALPAECTAGNYFAPCAFKLSSLDQLTHEIFGPILHVITYAADELDAVIDSINATGYGLTFGIHSRIDVNIEYISQRVRAGNIYVNRSMIGAVVGSQPFGGQGLSGTGPKAGGPQYLYRLCTEQAISIDTTASGGNASLMSLQQGLDVS